MKVALIGLGRMGMTQARLARYYGDEIVWGIDSEGEARDRFGKEFGVRTESSLETVDFRDLDLLWLTVCDGAIGGVAEACRSHLQPGTVVFHTSGLLPASIMKRSLLDVPCASYHPLLACPLCMVGDEACARMYAGVIHALEGDEGALRLAERLCGRLGAKPVRLTSEQKAKYHAAAVFASNYPLVILSIAEELFKSCGFSAADAARSVRDMAEKSLSSARSVSFCEALTGPAKRRDFGTLASHELALQEDADILLIYRALKDVILERMV